jgi:hypothetical protein
MIADSSSVAGDMLAVVLVYSALYFVPTIVAIVRKVSIPDIIFCSPSIWWGDGRDLGGSSRL